MYRVGGLPVVNVGGGGVQAVFLLLLVFVAVFAGLARRLKVPYPILLVIAGLLLSFLPGMPRIGLDPNLVFLVFLPPLLYSAAWTLSWREFQRNFVSIAMLAVGLVSFTVLGLALAAGSFLPGFDWKSAALLGAVVAATDAIAATSIARRVGLPQRIGHILEAESLVNDGTGLLALQFGLAMLMTGRTPRQAQQTSLRLQLREPAARWLATLAEFEAETGIRTQAIKDAQDALSLSASPRVMAKAGLALASVRRDAEAQSLMIQLEKRNPEDQFTQFVEVPSIHAALALNHGDTAT